MKRLAIGQHVVEFVAKATNEFGNFGAAQGIGLQEWRGDKWEMIAGVAYNDWNGVNVVSHIASDGSKRWMTREFLRIIFDYPFAQLKVKRITCLIGQRNFASIRLCEHFGFTLEARLEGAHPDGDMLIYRLLEADCRWHRLTELRAPSKASFDVAYIAPRNSVVPSNHIVGAGI